MSTTLERVRKPAPFPGFFALPEPAVLPKLHELDTAWLRWRATRGMNPFISEQTATGFEGYFVGLGLPADEVVQRIAQLGSEALKALRIQYRNNPQHLGLIWKVARGEQYNAAVLRELNMLLMANIARLRPQVIPMKNPQGDHFRSQVAQLVEHQSLQYVGEDERVVAQDIPIPTAPQPREAVTVTTSFFSRDQLQEGYTFMALLGKAGFPLVRLLTLR